jgi:hypothetical protein
VTIFLSGVLSRQHLLALENLDNGVVPTELFQAVGEAIGLSIVNAEMGTFELYDEVRGFL